jgi:hypothetical protein
MKSGPICPTILPHELLEPLREFAGCWANSDLRPRPTHVDLMHWDALISSWAACDELPLFIRKISSGRGQFLRHRSGRILVPVDNSPAHWAFIQALTGQRPDLEDVRSCLSKDQIPVAMILKKAEKELAQLTCTRVADFSLNHLGWKLAHIEGVGLNDRMAITEQPIEVLKRHFMRLMSPANMFLMPLTLEGLAEIPVVIEEIRKVNEGRQFGL